MPEQADVTPTIVVVHGALHRRIHPQNPSTVPAKRG